MEKMMDSDCETKAENRAKAIPNPKKLRRELLWFGTMNVLPADDSVGKEDDSKKGMIAYEV